MNGWQSEIAQSTSDEEMESTEEEEEEVLETDRTGVGYIEKTESEGENSFTTSEEEEEQGSEEDIESLTINQNKVKIVQ